MACRNTATNLSDESSKLSLEAALKKETEAAIKGSESKESVSFDEAKLLSVFYQYLQRENPDLELVKSSLEKLRTALPENVSLSYLYLFFIKNFQPKIKLTSYSKEASLILDQGSKTVRKLLSERYQLQGCPLKMEKKDDRSVRDRYIQQEPLFGFMRQSPYNLNYLVIYTGCLSDFFRKKVRQPSELDSDGAEWLFDSSGFNVYVLLSSLIYHLEISNYFTNAMLEFLFLKLEGLLDTRNMDDKPFPRLKFSPSACAKLIKESKLGCAALIKCIGGFSSRQIYHMLMNGKARKELLQMGFSSSQKRPLLELLFNLVDDSKAKSVERVTAFHWVFELTGQTLKSQANALLYSAVVVDGKFNHQVCFFASSLGYWFDFLYKKLLEKVRNKLSESDAVTSNLIKFCQLAVGISSKENAPFWASLVVILQAYADLKDSTTTKTRSQLESFKKLLANLDKSAVAEVSSSKESKEYDKPLQSMFGYFNQFPKHFIVAWKQLNPLFDLLPRIPKSLDLTFSGIDSPMPSPDPPSPDTDEGVELLTYGS